MKRQVIWVTLSSLLTLVAIASPVSADVLDFEGLTGFIDPMPASYSGLEWQGFYALNNNYLAGFHGGYVDGAISGNTVIFNVTPDAASVSSTTPFTFNSAYFTGAFNDGLVVTVQGFVTGDPVAHYSATFTVDATTPSFEALNFTDINELRVYSSGGTLSSDPQLYGGYGDDVVIDNFSFTRDASPVPEPSSLSAMLIGLVCGALAIHRRIVV